MTRAMKDSGIEWIGEIPEDWEVKRLKNILKERKEKNDPIQTKEVLSLLKDRGVIPYSEKGDIGNKAKEDVSKYKLVYQDDIVVNSMNIIIGSVGKSNYYGAVSPVYYVLNTRNKYDINFYNYVLQSSSFQKSLIGLGNGILEHRMRIPMEKLNNVNLPIPPLEEQERIASILDEKVERIDAIIADTKQSIEELKQYKQSLITETVTKGLDKNVPMKDSGIEWIGQIPEDWEVVKLKRISQYMGSGGTPTSNNDDYYNGNYYWIQSGDLYNNQYIFDTKKKITKKALSDYTILKEIKAPFICMAMYGASIGNLAISQINSSCNQAVCTIKTDESYSLKFLYYSLLLSQPYLLLEASGGTQPNINREIIANWKILSPSLLEQQKIVDFLDNQTQQIDQLIQDKEVLIIQYEEYKKSMIYEYVTGKR